MREKTILCCGANTWGWNPVAQAYCKQMI